MSGRRTAWLAIVLGPALALVLGSAAALLWLPHPVPKTATGARQTYLRHCATCHGADGRGSWRARLLLTRPGDLTDPRTAALPDEYLFDLIKHGGAPIGKPGMPAFGFHLTDTQIRELVAHVKQLAQRSR